MSRVESPFHAIAAQALDDTPEVEANGSAAAVAAATLGSSSDARGQDRDSVKAASEFRTENGRNEAADKNGGTEEEAEEETAVRQERKGSLGVSSEGGLDLGDTVIKKSKKRTNVWTKTTSRKSAKKSSIKNNGVRPSDTKDDNVLLKPFHQEDDPAYPILLSKIYKAEKIELSVDRLAASGSKGYRMVRATRGVVEGAWYFEIYVEKLGETGHTRLGWSTRRGDIQAPVGYDAHSYSFRDVDGSKVHAALREDYGQAYHEEDVIGFYINLPREAGFTRKAEEVVGYKGQPYIIVADEPLKPVPGSEILFFKNGVCQGVAFRDINDGSYFPAASMYTHPSQDCCKVVFNFGPDFKYPATDLGDRPFPSPMCQASGPGEVRAETLPTTQTEVVADSADSGGDKQQMAPDCAIAVEVEEATTAADEENAPKDVGKVPSLKKKEKLPKVPMGNHLPPPSSKKPKAGDSRLNPEFKREVKASKDDTVRVGLGPTGLPSQKGGKKDISTTGSLKVTGIQKNTGMAILKGGKTDLSGTGLESLKGSKTGLTGAMVQTFKGSKKDVPGTGLPSQKGTGLPGIKGSKIDTGGTGLTSLKGSKKSVNITALQGLQGTKKGFPGPGFSSKGTKRDTPGSGLPIPKRSKKDVAETGSAFDASKDSTGLGSGSKASKKDFPGIGSVLKASKKDVTGGFLRRGLDSTALSGRRSWPGGIRGTTMDVDVVVVESSTSFQGEGSFR